MRTLTIVAIVGVLAACTPRVMQSTAIAAADDRPTCENPVGMWTNQLTPASWMRIASYDAATGALRGAYKSSKTDWYDLVGWGQRLEPKEGAHNAHILAWTVRWHPTQHGTITAWTGRCDTVDGTPTITSLWHYGQSVTFAEWAHFRAGSDIFTPAEELPAG